MRLVRTLFTSALLFFLFISFNTQASFHLWRINEVYSNADGTLQFIELFSTVPGQEFLADHDVTASPTGGSITVYTFDSNSQAPTDNKHLLLATRDFQSVTGIEPDFIIPTGFVPIAGGTLNFANIDEIDLANLPLDGQSSLNSEGTTGSASPTNFDGVTNDIASVEVSYDLESGQLSIAHVSVEGLGVYSASLTLTGSDPLTFDLADAVLLSETESQDQARFSVESGELILPRVVVGDDLYSATLSQDTEAEVLRFVLTGAELIE